MNYTNVVCVCIGCIEEKNPVLEKKKNSMAIDLASTAPLQMAAWSFGVSLGKNTVTMISKGCFKTKNRLAT